MSSSGPRQPFSVLYDGGGGGANGSVKPGKSRAWLFVDIDSRHAEYKCRFSTAARRRCLLTPAEGCEPITGRASGLSSQFEPLRWGGGRWCCISLCESWGPLTSPWTTCDRVGGWRHDRRRRRAAFCFRLSYTNEFNVPDSRMSSQRPICNVLDCRSNPLRRRWLFADRSTYAWAGKLEAKSWSCWGRIKKPKQCKSDETKLRMSSEWIGPGHFHNYPMVFGGRRGRGGGWLISNQALLLSLDSFQTRTRRPYSGNSSGGWLGSN